MIVLIGCEKGGTGKTTIATNLAALRALAGRDVLLVDTDPQGQRGLLDDIQGREWHQATRGLHSEVRKRFARGTAGSRGPIPGHHYRRWRTRLGGAPLRDGRIP